MSQPQPAQPYYGSPGLRVSIGDPDPSVVTGTDAFNGVIVLEAGVPIPYIVDAKADFQIKVYLKTSLTGAAYVLPDTLSVEFHIHDLAGVPVTGSPFPPDAPLAAETPAGAASVGLPEMVTWRSSTVTIKADTLTPDNTYRITVDCDDSSIGVFAFHDGAVIHTQA